MLRMERMMRVEGRRGEGGRKGESKLFSSVELFPEFKFPLHRI